MLAELQHSSRCSARNKLQLNFTALSGHGWQLFSKAWASATGLCPRPPFFSCLREKPVQPRLPLWSSRPVPCSAPSIIPPVNMGQLILLLGASGHARWREANRSSKTVLREIKLPTIIHSIEKGWRQTSQQCWRRWSKVYSIWYDQGLLWSLAHD